LENQNKERDKKSCNEWSNKCPENEFIEFPDHVSLLSISLWNASIKNTVFCRGNKFG
jgi:hypothetical protein